MNFVEDNRDKTVKKSLISQIGKSIDMMGGYQNLFKEQSKPEMLLNGEQVYQIQKDA